MSLSGEQSVGKARKQRRCPQCHRAAPEIAETCPFCQTALPSIQQPDQEQQPEPAVKLRDIFPVLSYDGDPLPRRGDPQEPPGESKAPGGR